MAEPNFWIDNAGSIITAGTALIGTLGGTLATNWIQERRRRAEERNRDREREIDAVTTALSVCKRWEDQAKVLTDRGNRSIGKLERLEVLQSEAYEALNVVRFIGGSAAVRGQARRIMETHRRFIEAARDSRQGDNLLQSRHELGQFLTGVRKATSDLDTQARKSILPESLRD